MEQEPSDRVKSSTSSSAAPGPAGRRTWFSLGHSPSTGPRGFDVEVLDLRDWALPMFTETFESVGDFNNPTSRPPSSARGTKRSLKLTRSLS